MRSASSRTLLQRNRRADRQRLSHILNTKHTQAADQVGDGPKVDQLVHLQVMEPAWGSYHDVHATLNLLDLEFPVPSAVDTNAETRRTQSELCSLNNRWALNTAGLNLL